MTLRNAVVSLVATLVVGCGGVVEGGGAYESADGGFGHDTGGGTVIKVDGATCVDVDPSSFSTYCNDDSDCTYVRVGLVCNGSCNCGDTPVNAAGAASYAAQTAPISFDDCPCVAEGELQCLNNQCIVCTGGFGDPPECQGEESYTDTETDSYDTSEYSYDTSDYSEYSTSDYSEYSTSDYSEYSTSDYTGTCEPEGCAEQGIECGEAGDGCGGILICGTCTPPSTCGGGGEPGVCGGELCQPLTCGEQGIECGPATDGCGDELACGPCPPELVCGGIGPPGRCNPPVFTPDAGVPTGSGPWMGVWMTTSGPTSMAGPLMMALTQAGGTLSGPTNFLGEPCFDNGTLTAMINVIPPNQEDFVGTVTGVGGTASIKANIIGNTMMGAFTTVGGTGVCGGYTGTFNATR